MKIKSKPKTFHVEDSTNDTSEMSTTIATVGTQAIESEPPSLNAQVGHCCNCQCKAIMPHLPVVHTCNCECRTVIPPPPPVVNCGCCSCPQHSAGYIQNVPVHMQSS